LRDISLYILWVRVITLTDTVVKRSFVRRICIGYSSLFPSLLLHLAVKQEAEIVTVYLFCATDTLFLSAKLRDRAFHAFLVGSQRRGYYRHSGLANRLLMIMMFALLVAYNKCSKNFDEKLHHRECPKIAPSLGIRAAA